MPVPLVADLLRNGNVNNAAAAPENGLRAESVQSKAKRDGRLDTCGELFAPGQKFPRVRFVREICESRASVFVPFPGFEHADRGSHCANDTDDGIIFVIIEKAQGDDGVAEGNGREDEEIFVFAADFPVFRKTLAQERVPLRG